MRYRLLFFSAITIALAASACWYIYQNLYPKPSASSVAAQPASRPAVQTINGETVVTVSQAIQQASHIEAASLALVTKRPDTNAWATVVDLQPLFDLHNRLAAARADLDTLTAQAGNSHTQYERSNVLYEDDRNVSQKSLQDARAVMQADQAKLQSATTTVSGLEATLRQQFGDALARASMDPKSDVFQRLLAGRTAVLRVTLPAGLQVTRQRASRWTLPTASMSPRRSCRRRRWPIHRYKAVPGFTQRIERCLLAPAPERMCQCRRRPHRGSSFPSRPSSGTADSRGPTCRQHPITSRAAMSPPATRAIRAFS